MLATLGDLLEDVAVYPTTAIREATDTPCAITRRRGGSAANAAVAAAATLGAGRVRFLGRVGGDPLGERLLTELEAAGVKACVQRGGRTGSVVVLVGDEGERTMLTDRGCSLNFSGYEESWLKGVKMLHVPGYSLMEGALAETAMAAISAVRAAGGKVSVDASSAGAISDVGVETFRRTLSEIEPDLLICNRSEDDLLRRTGTRTDDSTARGTMTEAEREEVRRTGTKTDDSTTHSSGPTNPQRTVRRTGTKTDDSTARAARAAATAALVRVTKDGPRAAVLSRRGEEDVLIHPPETLRTLDTTGAGDAFAGGLLAARLLGAAWGEAVRAGHRSANAHLKAMGAEHMGAAG